MNISGGNLIEQLLTDEILQELEQYYHLEKTERSFSDLRLIFATTVLGLKVAKEQRRSCLLELAKSIRFRFIQTATRRTCCGWITAARWITGRRCRKYFMEAGLT